MTRTIDRAPQMARSALLVAGVSAVTLVLTVAWQTLIARTFGVSTELDAFWVALGIPRAIAESFHLGLLTLLFVLVFRRAPAESADPWRRASAVLNVTLAATAVGIVLLVALAPVLVPLMAPGLPQAEQRLSASLMRWLALMLVPTAIAAALGGIAISRARLLAFTLSRAVMPALQIVVLLACAASLGVQALVWALWIGAAGALLVFVPWLRRTDVRYHFGFNWRDPSTREIVGLQAVLAVIWLLILLNQVVDRRLASLLGPGNVSALEFAWRFEIPISQIVSLGVALPTFALLAQSASSDRRGEFRATLAVSARLLVMTVVPMLGFLVVLRGPLARVWLERGAFSGEAAQSVAALLPALSIVYLCRAFASILVFGLLMVGRARLLVAGLTCELIAHAALGYLLAGTLGLLGVAVASALAMLVVNGALWAQLLRDVGAFAPGRIAAHVGPNALAVAVAASLLEVIRRVVEGLGLEVIGLQALVPIAAMGAAYLLVYVAACVGTGVIALDLRRPFPRVALRSLD